MTSSPEARAPRRPGRPRNEGQWVVTRTPFNANEQVKLDDLPLNARDRVTNWYQHAGFDGMDPADKRGRLRWWGLYTQRKPGIDGGKTALLEPEELEDSYFMLRVRIDGGQLNVAQLRAIASVSQDFGRDTADLTDRQNVQLHWIEIEKVPEIWDRLEGVGLHTTEACGDCPRVILGSPVAGVAEDEILDGTEIIEKIKATYIGDPELANLPRKFKTAISGHPSHDVVPQINDIAFAAVEHPEHGLGWDLWIGGGLSTTPMAAGRLGVWVASDDVPDVWAGVCRLFRDYGYRRLRTKARIKFLLKDWGAEKFRQVLEDEYLHRTLTDGPAAAIPAMPGDHIGVHRQRDGKFYIGAAPVVGRVSGSILAGVADIAEKYGTDRIRTTAHQKLLLLDIAEADIAAVVGELRAIGLEAEPSQWRRNTMACTGLEYCKLAIVETKAAGAEVVSELEKRIPDLDTPITVNINGCPNACARIQSADIGLKGQLVLGDDGQQVPGYQVHLGGLLGEDPNFGRKLRGHKVTNDNLADYIEKVTLNYLAERDDTESFADWAARAPEESLR